MMLLTYTSTLNIRVLMTTTLAFTLVPFPDGGLNECTGAPFVHWRQCLLPHPSNHIILGRLGSCLQNHIRHAADITHTSHLPCYDAAREPRFHYVHTYRDRTSAVTVCKTASSSSIFSSCLNDDVPAASAHYLDRSTQKSRIVEDGHRT